MQIDQQFKKLTGVQVRDDCILDPDGGCGKREVKEFERKLKD